MKWIPKELNIMIMDWKINIKISIHTYTHNAVPVKIPVMFFIKLRKVTLLFA